MGQRPSQWRITESEYEKDSCLNRCRFFSIPYWFFRITREMPSNILKLCHHSLRMNDLFEYLCIFSVTRYVISTLEK